MDYIDVVRIKNSEYCKELEKKVKQDEVLKNAVISLFKITNENTKDVKLLKDIDTYIDQIKEEIKKSSPEKIEEGETLLSDENPPVVSYQFMVNHKFTDKPVGGVFEFVEGYLRGLGKEFSYMRDTYDNINRDAPYFRRYNFVEDFKDGPSIVSIICSEYCKEIYVIKDFYSNYPIDRKELSNDTKSCIEIKKINEIINTEDLKRKLDVVLLKEKAEKLFQERFPGQDSDKFLSFALLQSLMTLDKELFNDVISNFRLLIDENYQINIPKFYLIDNESGVCVPQFQGINSVDYPCGLLYANDLLPVSLGENRDATLVEAFDKYNELCERYEAELTEEEKQAALDNDSLVELNGEKYTMVIRKVPEVNMGGKHYLMVSDKLSLYHLALHYFLYFTKDDVNDNGNLLEFYDNFSSELYKNVDKNVNLKANSELFKSLIPHALAIGTKEILVFAEKNHIGFHSGEESDINELIYFTMGYMMNLISVEKPDKETLVNVKAVYDFFIKHCGSEIFNKLSENSDISEKSDSLSNKFNKKKRTNRELSQGGLYYYNKFKEWEELCNSLLKKDDWSDEAAESLKSKMGDTMVEILRSLKKDYRENLRSLHDKTIK